MKKLKYIITLSLFLTNLFTSCEISFLDNQAFSDLTKEGYYKNITDYESALVGCYYYVSGRGTTKEGTYATGLPIMGEAGTDECYINANKGSSWDDATQLDQYATLNSNNLICQEVWLNSYSGINATNEIINRINQLDENTLNATSRYREIAAEASFLQALWYFNMVRIYGGVPIVVVPSKSSTDFKVERNTIKEVYDHIFDLLRYAEEFLPETVSQYGRAKKASAQALLAKAALHVASSMNLLAPKMAESVKLEGINSYEWSHIDESGREYSKEETLNYYYLMARDQARKVLDSFAPEYLMPSFTDCFYPHESSKEILFEAIMSTGLAIEMGGWFGSLFGPMGPSAQGGGQHVIFPVLPIVNDNYTYNMTASLPCTSVDERFNWTISTYQIQASGNVRAIAFPQRYKQFEIAKFRIDTPPSYNQDRTPVNNPILRVSEICLIYAEAQAELDYMDGKDITTEALEFLNVVRRRAKVVEYTDTTIKEVISYDNLQKQGNKEIKGFTASTSIEHFRRAILNERMLELLGEGHRWFDLVRMGVLKEVTEQSVDYARTRSGNNLSNPNIPVRYINDFNIFRPIPSREISLHGGTLIQNHGYI
jgi:hypothetical protein